MVGLTTQDAMDQKVKSLNALPRPSRLSSSKSLPNDWYFDVRYIPLEPTPHHILFLVRLGDKYLHTERLPLGLSKDKSGIEYFPQTADEAAPEVANALIHSFVANPAPSAPWKLFTYDPGLAIHVGNIFRKLGVREELQKIQFLKSNEKVAQTLCDDFFSNLTRTMGVEFSIPSPQTIGLSNYKPPRDDFFASRADSGGSTDVNLKRTLAYVQDLMNSRPLTTDAMSEDMKQGVHHVMTLFQTKSTAMVRAEADAGDPESALDFALR